jgi:hypothetical protein
MNYYFKNQNKKTYIYAWACDLSHNTGEGILANQFLKDLSIKKKYLILAESPQKKNWINLNYNLVHEKKNNLNVNHKSFTHKYISPIIGIINCWKHYLKDNRTCYINYLPLWNSIIFLLLPPKTILGPITGGSFYEKKFNINYFLRKYVLPILFLINFYIIQKRNKKILFATKLLKNIPKSKKNIFFNYVYSIYSKNKILKKNNDIVIYYRIHNNKMNNIIKKIVIELINNNVKINIVGDQINLSSGVGEIKNFGYVKRKKMLSIINKSKFAIGNTENLYSLFTIDCLSNYANIFINKNISEQIDRRHKKLFIKIDFQDYKKASNIIFNLIKNYKFERKLFKDINNNSKNNYHNFFK